MPQYKPLFIILSCLLLNAAGLSAQAIRPDAQHLQAVNVFMSLEKTGGTPVVKVIKDSAAQGANEATFVKVRGIDFSNGSIEVKLLSRLLTGAPESARGFIGIAFRISDSNTRFESIYLRPTNARADDQVRRNHSIQYYAYPDYKFDRLRRESPEKYESYADMEMNAWITMRIEVNGQQAKLFLNGNTQPSLIVNDLKLGAGAHGGIGFWVDGGTEGYFKDLIVTPRQ